MKNALKSFSSPHSSSASVVDGKLILSLPDAITPVVWQMDFSSVKASALEVRETKEGTFTLTLKTPKGEALDVAPFAKREQAINGLMAAARALENAQGRIHPGTSVSLGETQGHGVHITREPRQRGSAGKWIGTIAALALLVVLVGIWGSLAPRPPGGVSAMTTDIPSVTTPAERTPGVPQSADDFLKGQ
jgi:hypothetical protein